MKKPLLLAGLTVCFATVAATWLYSIRNASTQRHVAEEERRAVVRAETALAAFHNKEAPSELFDNDSQVRRVGRELDKVIQSGGVRDTSFFPENPLLPRGR